MRKSYKKTYRKMNRVKREIEAGKKGFSKVALIFILCGVCAGIVAAGLIGNYFTSLKREKNEVWTDSVVSMAGERGLPYIEMLFDDSRVYNRLTGYQSDEFSRTGKGYCLTILPEDLRQRILISEPYANVKSLSYQVRDLDTGVLVEETQVEEINETGGLTEAVLNIKNLINMRHEYNLQIKLERTDAPALIYNTRIEAIEEPEKVKTAITFTDEFIGHCVNDKDETYIDSLIDTQTSMESFNFADTDIHSPALLLMWKGLDPKSEERAIASLVSIDGGKAVITTSYAITVGSESAGRERVIVNDAFKVDMDPDEDDNALLSFRRKAYETVSGKNMRLEDDSVAFGFQADEDMQRMCSENGQYVCYVNGGNLWRICSGTGRESTGFSRIFSFESKGEKEGEVRTDLTPVIKTDRDGDILSCESGFGINIISVKDDGDVTFAVYGAFPGGVHTGESGIGIYEFNAGNGVLAEVLFVKTSKDVESMKTFAAESYLNDYGEMYVTVEGADLKINVDDYSTEVVTGESADDDIFYSDDASVMAYSAVAAGLSGRSDRIEIFDRDEEVLCGISAEKGKDLKILGFMGDDVVYGIAGEEDYESAVGGVKNYYERIVIADKGGNEVKVYGEADEFYSDVDIHGGTLEFTRVKKDNGSFLSGDRTGIVANNLYEDEAFVLYYDSSDERRKELFGSFVNGANDGERTVVVTDYEYNSRNTVEI